MILHHRTRLIILPSPLEGEGGGASPPGGGQTHPGLGTFTPHRLASLATSPSRGEVRKVAGPRRGLSLLEVLLSLAILVLALAAIGRLVDIGTDHGNQARAYNRGTRLAQSKMAEVEAGLIPVSSEATGQFEGDDAAWSYTVTPADAGPPNLYSVTVRVNTTLQGRPIEVVLTQMVFDPSLMGSAAQAERPADTGTTDTTGMGGATP